MKKKMNKTDASSVNTVLKKIFKWVDKVHLLDEGKGMIYN